MSDFHIKIEDFYPKYPNIDEFSYDMLNPYEDEKNFYEDIYIKKEFYDEKLDEYEKKPKQIGELLKHQKFIARFLSQHTLYDGILLFHEMGTGKACSAIAAAEKLKNNNFDGAIILAKGSTILDNMKNEIAKVCTDGSYIPVDYEDFSEETKKKRLNKSLATFYSFETFEKFSKKINIMKDEDIIKNFSNKVIIIDEVHNLPLKIGQDKNQYRNIYRFLHTIKNKKVILLTGTPMTDKPQEIAAILNLILPKEKQMPVQQKFIERFISKHEDGSIKLNFIDELKEYFKGYISYLRVSPPNKNLIKEFVSEEIDGYSFSKFNVFPDFMSDFQTKNYLKNFRTNKTKDEGIVNDVKKEAIYTDSRQSSLFVFPDNSQGKAGFEKYIKVEDIGIKNKGKKKYIMKTELRNLLTTDGKGDLEKLGEYSSKYALVIKQILDAKDKSCFVYCSRVSGSGAILFSLILELFSFKKSIGRDKNPDLRYGILTSKTPKSEINNIKDAFNRPDNMHGEYIKLIIGSQVVSEGLSFKNIQETHILTPHWNFAETDQAIHRTIRAFSHEDLIKSGMETIILKIYLHASIPQEDSNILPNDSVDLLMYKISENKDMGIKKIERIIRESAVDCALNYNRNKRSEKYDNFRECEYEKCEYSCDGINYDYESSQSPSQIPFDFDTYQLYFTREIINKLITIIEDLFKKNFFLKFHNIIDSIELDKSIQMDYNNFILLKALNKITSDKIPVINKYGFTSFLSEENNIYYLVDRIDSQYNLTDYFYTQFPSIKDGESINSYYKKQNINTILDLLIKNVENRQNILSELTRKDKEIILEMCLLSNKLELTKNIEFRDWIINYFQKYLRKEDDGTIVSTLLVENPTNIRESDLRCLGSVNMWSNCNSEIFEKYKSQISEKISKNKYGYHGSYNSKRQFIIHTQFEQDSKDRRKLSRGKVCKTWQKGELEKVINDINNKLPDEDKIQLVKKDKTSLCEKIKDFFEKNNLIY